MRREHEELRKQRLDEFMAGFNVIGLKLKEMYQMITLGGDAELELVDSLDPFSGVRACGGWAVLPRVVAPITAVLLPSQRSLGCAEGILFSVRPPKKSWKNIANLSGGEKTLSSLSLVFALHHFKPTPLYVMDEIDAALGAHTWQCAGAACVNCRYARRDDHAWDTRPWVQPQPRTPPPCACADFKNVSIVGHYIKERTKNAQFVIISLRNNMFELADRLVGIYKVGTKLGGMLAQCSAHGQSTRVPFVAAQTDNATKSVAINPHQFTVGAVDGQRQCGGDLATAEEGHAQQEQRPPQVAAA